MVYTIMHIYIYYIHHIDKLEQSTSADLTNKCIIQWTHKNKIDNIC